MPRSCDALPLQHAGDDEQLKMQILGLLLLHIKQQLGRHAIYLLSDALLILDMLLISAGICISFSAYSSRAARSLYFNL